MPEGLSPGEVGKEISEHRAHTLEEKESSGAEAKGRDRALTIIEAVLLAVVAVLAAWSGFAAAKWGTESSLDLAKASAARTEFESGRLPGRRPEEFRRADIQRLVHGICRREQERHASRREAFPAAVPGRVQRLACDAPVHEPPCTARPHLHAPVCPAGTGPGQPA